MTDDRSQALQELVGAEIREVGLDSDIHARVVFSSGATLDFYRMPEILIDGRRLRFEDDGFREGMHALATRKVTNAEATHGSLDIALGPNDGLSVPLGGSLKDVSSYDVAVFHPVETDAVMVWPVGE